MYNPYHCYKSRYNTSAQVTAGANDWPTAYNYCESLTSGSTLVRIEDTIYDQPSVNFYVKSPYFFLLWVDSQQLVNSATSFLYGNGNSVPKPYYQYPSKTTASWSAPADRVVLYEFNIYYSHPTSGGVAGTVCQYGT